MDLSEIPSQALESVLDEFDGTHDLLLLLLYGLNEKTAQFKAHPIMPSIFDILWHMAAVKRYYTDIALEKERPDFNKMPRPQNLAELLAWFDEVHADTRHFLVSQGEDWLGSIEAVPDHEWATRGFIVSTLSSHDRYHLGQMSQMAWAFPEMRWPGWVNDGGAPYLFQVETPSETT
jgi:hypothetical protein